MATKKRATPDPLADMAADPAYQFLRQVLTDWKTGTTDEALAEMCRKTRGNREGRIAAIIAHVQRREELPEPEPAPAGPSGMPEWLRAIMAGPPSEVPRDPAPIQRAPAPVAAADTADTATAAVRSVPPDVRRAEDLATVLLCAVVALCVFGLYLAAHIA